MVLCCVVMVIVVFFSFFIYLFYSFRNTRVPPLVKTTKRMTAQVGKREREGKGGKGKICLTFLPPSLLSFSLPLPFLLSLPLLLPLPPSPSPSFPPTAGDWLAWLGDDHHVVDRVTVNEQFHHEFPLLGTSETVEMAFQV